MNYLGYTYISDSQERTQGFFFSGKGRIAVVKKNPPKHVSITIQPHPTVLMNINMWT
jgi:hypothetical protein